ncbi:MULTISPECIES: hypothetical protein [unclassified Anabaena]|uniref:hypothetical protein n=1 Tax=unclassified Anabaena TaxID=2619674 RepID=UPI0039C6448A
MNADYFGICDRILSLVNLNGFNSIYPNVVVNLGDVPSATSPGTPSDSYGFIRFWAKIK